MSRSARAYLSPDHLIHNWRIIRDLAPKSSIWSMIKANAYGHGIRSTAKHLEPVMRPNDAFGVASIDEALALRHVGIQAQITLMEGVFKPDELPIAAQHGFNVVFHNWNQVQWLETCDPSMDPISGWIKINTGMGRLGFNIGEAHDAHQKLSASPHLNKPIGIMSHFACADDMHNPLNHHQIEAFKPWANMDGQKSMCNSSATFHWAHCHFDVVRPGLALYGLSPIANTSAHELGLKPVMTLQTEIIALHQMLKGTPIGYGATYTCPTDMPVGIAAIGYGDGYPRLANGAPTWINNTICSIIGRVSMDMMAIDLRPLENIGHTAQIGETVYLWGNNYPVEPVLEKTARNAYDLITNVQHRVKFIWKETTAQSDAQPETNKSHFSQASR